MSNQEIERKFLVKGDFKNFATNKYRITQGFLSSVPERTVRVRIQDDRAFLTIKGLGNIEGTTRFEWEKEISVSEAKELLEICEEGIIDKTRYIIPTKPNLFFEVDCFFAANESLIVAEIELPAASTVFEKPDWLGKEVTGDLRYYNSMLSKEPFNTWK